MSSWSPRPPCARGASPRRSRQSSWTCAVMRRCAAPPAGVLRLDADSVLPGVTSRLSVWLARDSLQLLQRERVDSVRDGRYKLTRFLVDGGYELAAPGRTEDAGPGTVALAPQARTSPPAGPSCARTDALGVAASRGRAGSRQQARAESPVCTDEAWCGSCWRVPAMPAGAGRATVRRGKRCARESCRRVSISVAAPDAKVERFSALGLARRARCLRRRGLRARRGRCSGGSRALATFMIEATRVDTGDR